MINKYYNYIVIILPSWLLIPNTKWPYRMTEQTSSTICYVFWYSKMFSHFLKSKWTILLHCQNMHAFFAEKTTLEWGGCSVDIFCSYSASLMGYLLRWYLAQVIAQCCFLAQTHVVFTLDKNLLNDLCWWRLFDSCLIKQTFCILLVGQD